MNFTKKSDVFMLIVRLSETRALLVINRLTKSMSRMIEDKNYADDYYYHWEEALGFVNIDGLYVR